MCRFSVIVPTYNVKDKVEKTIESVLKQKFQDYEIIIMDGDSNDGTKEVVRQYSDTHIKMISQKDDGIYDAMNKGVREAAGDYCIFLGAGDTLYDESVLEKVDAFVKAQEKHPDVVYGYVYNVLDGKEEKFCRKLDFWYTVKFDPVCHQAVFAARELFDEKAFDAGYVIAADQDWMMCMKRKKKRVVFIDEPVARYLMDGVSSSDHGEAIYLREQKKIHKEYFPCKRFVIGIYRRLKGDPRG